jgi:DNA-directed RNA polymerase subunit RPC12/RpoP
MVPYLCISCAANLEAPIKVADIQAAKQKIPDSKCPKCGAKAVFDDHPEEYFIFLNR